jgi:uncharacterized protein DUF4336
VYSVSHLEPIGDSLWIAEGPVLSFEGFPYPTRMAVIRLDNRDLFMWSPVALTPELKDEIEALGPVRHLVSPNKLHHLSLPEWHAAFPGSLVYASPGLIRKHRDMCFQAELRDAAEPAWAGELDQVAMAGSFVMTEIVFFHRLSRTALFGDLVENFRPDWFKGWRAVLARVLGIVMPNGRAPLEWRLTFWNRRTTRARLSRILAWQVERVVMAHGEIVRSGGAEFVRKSFRWLG